MFLFRKKKPDNILGFDGEAYTGSLRSVYLSFSLSLFVFITS